MKDEARKVYAAWAKNHPKEAPLIYHKAKEYSLGSGQWCTVMSGSPSSGCSGCPFYGYSCQAVPELREIILSFWEQEDI